MRTTFGCDHNVIATLGNGMADQSFTLSLRTVQKGSIEKIDADFQTSAEGSQTIRLLNIQGGNAGDWPPAKSHRRDGDFGITNGPTVHVGCLRKMEMEHPGYYRLAGRQVSSSCGRG